MIARPDPRAGVTLVELVVALAVVGIAAAVVGLAARALERTDPASERAAALAAARREALETRRPVLVEVAGADGPLRLWVAPDGSARGDSALGVDPLTGRARADAP